MRRRGFIKRLIFAAAVLTAGSLPYGLARLLSPTAEAAAHTHLRPPGALQDDDAFTVARHKV